MTTDPSMPDLNVEDLDSRWSDLPIPPSAALEARRVASWAGGPVLVGVDAAGGRHLLVGLPNAAPVRVIRPVRGLRIERRRLRVRGAEEGEWLDLVCSDATLHRLFSPLCRDVVRTLAQRTSPDVEAVLGVVERWRRFWSVSPNGLGREAELGLLGELWLLTRWLPVLNLPAVRSWVGPLGGRHDFACADISAEVKTSGAPAGPTVHRIHSLDQLAEPETGALHILSLRFIPDALGAVSLDAVVEDARRQAADDSETAEELDQRLASVGWTPADRGKYLTTWRLASQVLYEVGEGFPRLTNAFFARQLPPGVHDIAYSLDMTSCAAWMIDDRPNCNSRLWVLGEPGKP
ncbi:PD-(D/E)XK motif protein [Micromonospora sp. NPDC005173]|uniref:PD-(D/E)XK motif protein n=1 Tax=Micromonospora sp. NPDC005173 TaxID=3157165 RepID=UPI0033B79974